MFLVELTEKGGQTQRCIFEQPEVTIGRVVGNDVVLPKGNVSKRHARCVYRDGKHIIVDLKSTNGTFVNGNRVTSPIVLRDDDEVVIGDFTLAFGSPDDAFEDEDTLEVDATELRLLSALTQRDEASRMVYADWLEEHGDPVRAEFLRVQQTLVATMPADPAFSETSDRLRELAAAIDLRWRFKVARPLIEKCVAVEFECPKDWGSLATTEKSSVRYCSACAKRVFYCTTVNEAMHQAQRGNCVAIDIVPLRRPRDLEPPIRQPMLMGRMVTPRPAPAPGTTRPAADTWPPPDR